MERLNKLLAHAGVGSRHHVEEARKLSLPEVNALRRLAGTAAPEGEEHKEASGATSARRRDRPGESASRGYADRIGAVAIA
jgi:hypothetical protein